MRVRSITHCLLLIDHINVDIMIMGYVKQESSLPGYFCGRGKKYLEYC